MTNFLTGILIGTCLALLDRQMALAHPAAWHAQSIAVVVVVVDIALAMFALAIVIMLMRVRRALGRHR